MMMKNFLKSTVSTFVLLSALSTFTPSLGMEEGGGEEEKLPHVHPQIPKDIVNILTPLEERHLQSPRIFTFTQENYDSNKPISALPIELIQMILSFVDVSGLLNAQNVCKQWRSLIILEGEQQLELLKQWQPMSDNGRFTCALTANPHTLISAHHMLARLKLLYPTMAEPYPVGNIPIPTVGDVEEDLLKLFQQDPKLSPLLNPTTSADKFAFGVCSKNFIPGIVRKHAFVLNDSPLLHPFVSRFFLNSINVLDIHATSLAAYFIKHVPGLQDIFQKIVKAIPFEPSKFTEDANNPENYSQLDQYLKALRLLALSGDAKAKDRLNEFSEPVREFLDSKALFGQQDLQFTGRPLLGAYTQDDVSLTAQWNSINSSHHTGIKLDPNHLRAFWEYISIVDPRVSSRFIKEYVTFLESHDRSEDKEYIINIVRSLSPSTLKELLNSDNHNIPYFASVESDINFSRYWLATQILDEAEKRFEGDPFLARVRFYRAMCNFVAQDEKRFLEAEDYLQKVLEYRPEASEETSPSAKWERSKALRTLFQFYIGTNNEEGIRKVLPSLNEADLRELVTPPEHGGLSLVEGYIHGYNSASTILILEEADKQFADDPLRLKIRLLMAQNIVEAKVKDRFSEAEKYLQEVIEHNPEGFDENAGSKISDRFKALPTLFRLHIESDNEEDFRKLLFSLSKADLKELVTPPEYGGECLVERFISDRHFALPLLILEEARKQLDDLVEDDPLRLRIELNIAGCILGTQDKERFLEAEGYIKKVMDRFKSELPSDPKESFIVDKSANSEETETLGRGPGNENNRNIALQLSAALHIYRDQFREAYESLRASIASEDEFFMLQSAVLSALQRQIKNPALPPELIKFVGEQVFPDFFGSPEELKKDLKEDPDFGEEILEEIKVNKWLFDEALKRGLLEKTVFDEVVEFCESLENPSSDEIPGNESDSEGEGKPEKDK